MQTIGNRMDFSGICLVLFLEKILQAGGWTEKHLANRQNQGVRSLESVLL